MVSNIHVINSVQLSWRLNSSVKQQNSLLWGYPRCNIIYSFSLFYGLLLGLGLLLRMICFRCFTSAVRNKLYYTGDEPFCGFVYYSNPNKNILVHGFFAAKLGMEGIRNSYLYETKHTQRFRNMYIMLKSIMFDVDHCQPLQTLTRVKGLTSV